MEDEANMHKFLKIVAVVVESQEHRPLVLSGQDGGSNQNINTFIY